MVGGPHFQFSVVLKEKDCLYKTQSEQLGEILPHSFKKLIVRTTGPSLEVAYLPRQPVGDSGSIPGTKGLAVACGVGGVHGD